MPEKFVQVDSSGKEQEREFAVASTGAPDAGRGVGLDESGKLDPSVLPTGVGADVIVAQASEDLDAGDIVNVWNDGGSLLYRHSALNHVCGSSLIIRSDLYRLPQTFEEATPDYIKKMLGSHRRIADLLAARGTPLASLPFPGAIYRVGHAGSHSQTPPILRKYVLNRQTIVRPHRIVTNLARLRLVDGAARREFFGNVVRDN